MGKILEQIDTGKVAIADPDGNSGLDATTADIKAILQAHHEVHEGDCFITCDIQNVNGTTMQWMITTPDSLVYAHMVFAFEGTGELQVVVTEGADRNGTNALDEVNRRRVGTPNVAGVVIHRAVSGGTTDGATEIFCIRAGATGQGNKTVNSGGGRGINEFVLKPNTKYVVTVTTYADIYVTAKFDWYEHTDL